MGRVNNSKLFSNVGFNLSLLRGFSSKTSRNYKSINNEGGRSTLYIPALKALVAYTCEGRKVWDETLSYDDIYNNDSGIVAAVAQIGNQIIAEYRISEDDKHLACFDVDKKEFLFAGITEDNGETYKTYVLDYKDGRNGTVLWLALMPYLRNASNEMQIVFFNLFSTNDSIRDNYKNIVNQAITELPTSVKSQCFVFCDAVYHSVDRTGFSAEIKASISNSGVLPMVPDEVKNGVYLPSVTEINSGKFTLKGLADTNATPAHTSDVTTDELFCKYALNENMTDEEKSKVTKMYDSYVTPKWVLKAAHNIKFNNRLPLPQSMKQNNIFLFGPPGSGKTDGAKAIASALGLPDTHISMSSNSDEFVFTGNIIPEVEGLNDKSTDVSLDIFQKYTDINQILEFAELSPEIVYKDITGKDKEDASISDVVEAYAQYVASEKIKSVKKSSKNGISYKFVESVFCQAIENGWLVTIEEFTNVRDAGIAMVINQLMDGYQMITLPTGKVVKRHPNSVIVFASNVDEAQCGEFEASTLSRLKPMYRIEMPSKGDMIKRVKAMTSYKDINILEKMANVIVELQKYIKDNALVGVCGVREFAGWVLQYQANLDFESNLDKNLALIDAANETIVPSASPHEEDIECITRDIINTMLV